MTDSDLEEGSSLGKNKSFRSDFNSPHRNAVVGGYWAKSKDYTVCDGFMQATLALLAVAEAGGYTPTNDDCGYVSIDALVYPICFNARHFIELFLKDAIHAISGLNKKRPSDKVKATHELTELWDTFVSTMERDSRLLAFGMPLKEVFMEFAEVDNTSMTFRYPSDLDGKAHLSDLVHINIEVLGTRLRKVFNYADEFTRYLKVLQHEYEQNSYTNKLNRGNIEDIARRLPVYDKWSEDLIYVKEQLCSEFHLSSNDFGKVLELIKHNREFSILIGIELPLEGLPVDVFSRLASIHANEGVYDLITKDEWLRLDAIMAIGYSSHYSEEYDLILKEYSALGLNDYCIEDIVRKAFEDDQILRCGLLTLGQHKLLAALAKALPQLSEPLAEMPETEYSTYLKNAYFKMMRPNPF